MKTEAQLELIKMAGPIVASIFQSFHQAGLDAQAEINTLVTAADSDWNAVKADGPTIVGTNTHND